MIFFLINLSCILSFEILICSLLVDHLVQIDIEEAQDQNQDHLNLTEGATGIDLHHLVEVDHLDQDLVLDQDLTVR